MKKAIKLVTMAAAVVTAGAIGTAIVSAWGDNSGGRRTYTVAQINNGDLGNKIVFNSIKDDSLKDGSIKDERNFVAARDKSTGNNGVNNVWQNNEITVEEGKTYIIRLYVHNNSPKGRDAVAKNVTTNFSLGTVVSTEQRVDGYINSSNATPSKYWDDVVFKSNNGKKFYLDYVEGSALLENNGVGKNGGVKLADSVVTNGVKIGYDSLNGEVPGCYGFDNYVTIEVKPVFESSEISKTVRKLTDKSFSESVKASIGETVEFQIMYKNLNATQVSNTTLNDSLPKGLEYVKNSTKIYNATYPNGATVTSDKLTSEGINIGGYKVGANAYIRFQAKVVDNALVCGTNRLINWAKAVNYVGTSTNVNYFAVQDSAEVYVEKTCETPETYKCEVVNGVYYGKNGNVVTKEVYEKECTTPETHKCEVISGVYYGKDGNVVTKEVYDKECTTPVVEHKCEVVSGVYYGKNGNVVDEKTYKSECESTPTPTDTHKCEVVKGTYYGINGDTVDYDTYKAQCEKSELPNTGASSIATGVAGLGGTVTVAGYYLASRKQLRK